MNKFLNIIKIILLFLLIYFNVRYYFQYKFLGVNLVEGLYLIYFLFFSVFVIYDTFKANNYKFNIITCIILFTMALIFTRCFYDTGFISNSIYMSNINNYMKFHSGETPEVLEINKLYIIQNIPYFILLTILSFIYRFINRKITTK